jgi:hypothetical protein
VGVACKARATGEPESLPQFVPLSHSAQQLARHCCRARARPGREDARGQMFKIAWHGPEGSARRRH